ncbi:hypothetical protein EDD11_005218 [Mortierella claussenii]|nr:hypothetical protein EDD11_005218 [Mortierella claussenii]
MAATVTTAIEPNAPYSASKAGSVNNNITISSVPASSSDRSDRINKRQYSSGSSVSGGNGPLQKPPGLTATPVSTMLATVSTTTTTTTTFYSGVKLAPPVLSASVEGVERRALDQKAWYIIQVFPCDIEILSPTTDNSKAIANCAIKTYSSRNAATGAIGQNSAVTKTSIPRKPYKIYRRYEDVADFADQLEEEMATLTSQMQGLTTSTSASTTDVTASFPSTSSVGETKSTASDLSAFAENGAPTVPLMNSGSNCSMHNINMGTSPGLSAQITFNNLHALPRLKSCLVLFVTKAVCLRRKEEIDRYLQELFAVGPIITQSRLVAEFFGIWKTDMEIHLRQEDRDPLALHPMLPTLATTTLLASKGGSQGVQDQETLADEEEEETPDCTNKQELQRQDDEEDQALTAFAAGHSNRSSVSSTAGSPARRLSDALLPDVSEETDISRSSSTASSNSSSSAFSDSRLQQQLDNSSETTKMAAAHPSSYVASQTEPLTPIKTQLSRKNSSAWSAAQECIVCDSGRHSSDRDIDSEMVSPTTETAAPVPSLIQNKSSSDQSTLLTAIESNIMSRMAAATTTEGDGVIDITTRTIKRLKSLRRTNSSHSQKQQQGLQGAAQDAISRADSTSTTVTTAATATATANIGQMPTTGNTRPKVMKRSKTIVFRPEVTMQPLSSKNVIPPWNRIPAVAGNTADSSLPISPISPIGLGGLNQGNESSSATANTFLDIEERPRKLTLTHSKTMSAIPTMHTLSTWGIGQNDSGSIRASGSNNSPSNALSTQSDNSNALNGRSSASDSGFRARSKSISSASSATPLVAPWNRAHSYTETNMHLHSLIKVSSGQPSSSHPQSSLSATSKTTYIPLELGRAFHKKDGVLQKSSHIMPYSTKSSSNMSSNLNSPISKLPLLTQPSEARNKASFDLDVQQVVVKNKGSKRLGMTHSVSAPGGFLTASFTAPTAGSSETCPLETESAALSGNDSSHHVKATATLIKKRPPRRESTGGLHSPPMSTKQPVGILKNTQSGNYNGSRKSSLTIPSIANMFPVQSPTTSPAFKPTITTTAIHGSGPIHHGSGLSIATTFKIVLNADTIVALQVHEDKDFVLTLEELKARVTGKLLKSNIELPDKFDLIWVMSTSSSSTSNSAPNTPVSPSTSSSTASTAFSSASASSASIHHMLDPGVALRTDEDLKRAIQSCRSRKVTLRCAL